MTNTKEIVKRLLRWSKVTDPDFAHGSVRTAMIDAADIIEAQAKRIAHLEDAIRRAALHLHPVAANVPADAEAVTEYVFGEF